MKKKIIIFSGGSGNSNLIRTLASYKDIDLKIIINGYDDGKSTGYLRNKISGMLGPSDFRKNCVNILSAKKENKNQIKILEYRFKNKNEYLNLLKYLFNNKYANNELIEYFKKLNWFQFNKIKISLISFNNTFKNKSFNFKDISLGNIIFSGIYLQNRNFNVTIKKFTNLFGCKDKIFNVTNGQNLKLVGLGENGEILKKEEDIVENRHKCKIEDIYLLNKKTNLKKKNLKSVKNILKKNQIFPKINFEIIKIISSADHIIYGSGTQYASLFPSYLTKGLKKIILKSNAQKHYIGNIYYDKDIVKDTTENLINKFYFYFNIKKKVKENFNLIDNFFLHKIDYLDKNLESEKYLKLGNFKKKNYQRVFNLDYEKDNGQHYPGILLKKILNKKFLSKNKIFSTVSFVIPVKNEVKNLKNLFLQLNKIKFLLNHINYEVIFIDGGSEDGTKKKIKKFKLAKFYSLHNVKRGEAIKFGIKKSKGEIIAIFPSDNEYLIEDSLKLVEEIYLKKYGIVFGSRIIKSLNFGDQIKKVYKNNILGSIISKYGGILISLITLIFYNRYLTDPLTTIKAFDANLIKNIKLKSKGIDLDAEIFAKITNKKIYIHEMPVNYKPRSYKEGKKITIFDGLGYIWKLLYFKYFD